jgi:hypothetical protein
MSNWELLLNSLIMPLQRESVLEYLVRSGIVTIPGLLDLVPIFRQEISDTYWNWLTCYEWMELNRRHGPGKTNYSCFVTHDWFLCDRQRNHTGPHCCYSPTGLIKVWD